METGPATGSGSVGDPSPPRQALPDHGTTPPRPQGPWTRDVGVQTPWYPAGEVVAIVTGAPFDVPPSTLAHPQKITLESYWQHNGAQCKAKRQAKEESWLAA